MGLPFSPSLRRHKELGVYGLTVLVVYHHLPGCCLFFVERRRLTLHSFLNHDHVGVRRGNPASEQET